MQIKRCARRLQAAWEHFGSEGRRVIAFAVKYFEADVDTKFTDTEMDDALENLMFLGMAAIMDPPRLGKKNLGDLCYTLESLLLK